MQTIIIIKEKLVPSILKDSSSFGIMVASMWINHKFLGDHGEVAAFFLILIAIMGISKATSSLPKFKSREDAIRYIRTL